MFEMGGWGGVVRAWFLLFLVMTLAGAGMAKGADKERTVLGVWTKEQIDSVLAEASAIADAGERIGFISERFLGTGYREHTLIGDPETIEVFVVNLKEVDCFTFIDYVEAMRLSGSYSEFRNNLKRVRYLSGKVAFGGRNHFFTDWVESNPDFVENVTLRVAGGKLKRFGKTLNVKRDGTYFLLGIDAKKREVRYIPSSAIDDAVIQRLKTGDYVGIYSRRQGLDVSHVGILIKQGDSVYLRHASSNPNIRKVVDQDFRKYIADKPGIVVLRPKS